MGYFAKLDPYHRLGLLPVTGSRIEGAPVGPGLEIARSPGVDDVMPPWSPESPMFWFAGLLLVTFGLVAASTSLRVGPLRGSLAVGK